MSAKQPHEILAENDPERMGTLVAAVGPLELPPFREPFFALARAIVGQQLSMAAASTIFDRLLALGDMEPETLVALDEDELRAVGLSRAKAGYLKDLAARVLDGRLDLAVLPSLPDDEVIAQVTEVRGIGRWSAEMFLIFALNRPDVLALDDAGLLRAAGWLLGLGRPASRDELADAGERWRPYRSLASLYLWRAIGMGLVKWASAPEAPSAFGCRE